MHTLLDLVEAMILEGLQKPEDRDRYWRKVYTPPAGTMRRRPPPGWDRESELAGFDELL